ncbi:DMT family transporter [Fertoebacter nigrum]|uniref:DMT family transporter n=1 Tax=Fertoeibacter niger TaxID=2656921 RepID=A0A8X8KKQ5_9RHOB|nr:DMT family transporter [Fertoeibacter niger]NUB44539.1 DMT family transporter [Fertoeibacter niger]
MALSDNMRGALYMNVAMAAFTLNDTAMKVATQTMPLFQAITLRGAMVLPLLVVLGLMLGNLRLGLRGRDRVVVAVRSLAEVGGTALFLAALVHLPLANLSAILQSLPLAVTLAAAVILRERVGWRRMLAIAIGFGGVLLIVRPGAEGFNGWSLMGLASVACVVVRDLVTRELSRDVQSVTVAIYAAMAVTVMGLIGAAFQGWQTVTVAEWGMVLAASGALIFGYMFSVMVMRVGDISFVAPFRYTALLWAIFLGWLVFDSLPDLWTVVGAVIVVATGIFTFYREAKLARAAR